MTETAVQILTKVAELEAEIADLPDPPAYRRWDVLQMADLRARGPEWSIREWFGAGDKAPDRVRQRFLRCAYTLAADGLLTITPGEGGRIRNVKLTPAGRAALATLHPVAEPVGAGS